MKNQYDFIVLTGSQKEEEIPCYANEVSFM